MPRSLDLHLRPHPPRKRQPSSPLLLPRFRVRICSRSLDPIKHTLRSSDLVLDGCSRDCIESLSFFT
ncbi:MAG: hypothetical protein GY929_07940 [Actinomycetia bacterium]|nr:hypothetical protein [Actinomycetes bacterium]